MKKKHGLILAMMISAAAVAQVATNAPAPAAPATPAPVVDASVAAATNQPAAKKPKKIAKKKTTADKKKPAEAPAFGDNETATVKQNNTNVRGQANINSEVVTHLKQGDAVVVMKEVTLKHPKTDEPAKWAQIALPAGTHVWVNGTFLDTNQTVAATKLNIRTGPGENYSVIGMLHKGDAVKALNVKGDWAEIEAPPGTYAFVAAHLLAHKEPGATPTEPTTPTTQTVADNNTKVTTPTEPTTPATPTAPAVTPTVPPVQPPPPVDETPAKRVVQREGIVGGTVSIQAPTHFELESLDDGKPMDYLYTTSTNLMLQRYKGLTVLVLGEEALDERWPNTPVITVQKIQVVK